MLQIVALLLIAIDVDVLLLDGTTKTGSVTAIDDSTLTLQSADAAESLDLNEVLEVVSTEAVPATENADHQLILHDGSLIPCGAATVSAQDVAVRFMSVEQLTVPRSAVRAIRMQPENQEWRSEWDVYLQRQNDDDLLILSKRDGSGLDFYTGVVSGTQEDAVNFVLDGETIPVRRERIYGIVFPKSSETAGGRVTVELGESARLVAREILLDGDRLSLTTSWNQTLTIPANAITRIDFSSGRFHYLSDLDPVKESYLGTQPDGSLLEQLLSEDDLLGDEAMSLWKLHRDELPLGPYGPQPLTLRGRTYRKGIWLFPKCRIDYGLDGRYSSFQALAGVDDETAFNCAGPNGPSQVRLTILVDGDEAANHLINAPEDPVEIQLDVADAQTLSLLVDFGDDDSACDYLDLVEARLLLVP